MAVILNNQRSTYGNPYCYYTVAYTSIDNRTPTEVDVTFQVTSRLAGGSLGSGVVLKAQIYAGGSWREEITLKSSGEVWSGTAAHGKTFTLHIDNLNINMTTLSTAFKVTSNATGQVGGLNAISCSDITTPLSPPIFTSYTMTEVNSAISGISEIDTTIATNISKKRINVIYQLDPRTTLAKFEVENGGNGVIKESATNNFDIDFANTNLYISGNNKAPIAVKVYDGNGNSASSGLKFHNYIPYQPPTIVDNNVVAKRETHLSSTVVLSLNGTYYKSSDALNQSSHITVGYKYWENKDNPTIPSSYTTIPSASVTINNDGTFSVTNYSIGSSFDVEKSYRVLVKVSDSYNSYELSEPKSIPTNEPLWTEYKDRVNFKKLTIKGVEFDPTIYTGTPAFTKSSGNGNITSASYVKYGKVVDLFIIFNTSVGSTSAGSNIWVGTLGTSSLLPKISEVTGVGYYGSTHYIGNLNSSGTLTIRALGGTVASNTSDHGLHINYISV